MMTDTDEEIRKKNYVYGDVLRPDLLRVIPPDGHVIGSVGCGTRQTRRRVALNCYQPTL